MMEKYGSLLYLIIGASCGGSHARNRAPEAMKQTAAFFSSSREGALGQILFKLGYSSLFARNLPECLHQLSLHLIYRRLIYL